MPYYLDNAFLLDDPWITVVGCGGTGGFVAEGLCRLFQGRQANIVLVDHDRVEPHNLLRQNFYPGDVGGFKSQVLADRLAKAYGRPVGYSVYPFREYEDQPHEHGYPGPPAYRDSLIIGCADNALARRAMAECLPGRPATVAHRRGQRHQLGAGPGRQRLRQCELGRATLLRRDLLPGSRAHAPAPRPVDGRVEQAAGRGLRGGPRPHRPGPDHQPDDGLAGAPSGAPHGGGDLPLHGPLPGHGARHGHAEIRHPGGGGAIGGGRLRPGRPGELTHRGAVAPLRSAHVNTLREGIRRETMSDKNGTTTTPHQVRGKLWQDDHSGLRRHKLMTKELGDTIPAIRSTANVEDNDDVVARAKLFCPYNGWALVRDRVGRRDRPLLRPRRGVRDGGGVLRANRVGGSHRVRRRSRHRARPLLGAEDPRRDQEGGAAGRLAAALQDSRRSNKEGRRPCQTKLERKQNARTLRAQTRVSSAIRGEDRAGPVVQEEDSNDAGPR